MYEMTLTRQTQYGVVGVAYVLSQRMLGTALSSQHSARVRNGSSEASDPHAQLCSELDHIFPYTIVLVHSRPSLSCVLRFAQMVPFKIIRADNGDAWVEVRSWATGGAVMRRSGVGAGGDVCEAWQFPH